MEILRTISLYVEGKDMPFLLIGGHAVNAYGISRQTGDIDFVVQRSAKPRWLLLMSKLNYTVSQDDDNFTRFKPDSLAAWPIDLMFVDDETFKKLMQERVEKIVGSTPVSIVSARHLATLKIHALKHYQEHRFIKDYNDLIGILRSKKAEISEEDLKELCVKYANIELFNRLKEDLDKR